MDKQLYPTELRAGLPPVPHFKVAGEAFRPGVSAADKCIIGRLSFQYGDSPLLPYTSAVDDSHTQLVDGKRIQWQRDRVAERKLLEDLKASGIVPMLDLIMDPDEMDLYEDCDDGLDDWDKYADEEGDENFSKVGLESAMVPADQSVPMMLAWIDYLDSSELEELCEQGWQIHIDPEIGLSSHDVADFVPAMEVEPEHGIDWFSFDVSFEVQGKTYSLIPLIARAIAQGFPGADAPDVPDWVAFACDNPQDGIVRLPGRRFLEIVDRVRHLFLGRELAAVMGPLKLDRLAAAGLADSLELQSSATATALATLGRALKDIHGLPEELVPSGVVGATLRPYQIDGFRWLRFLAKHGLNGILADDMGLGKTLQTLSHLAAEYESNPGKPTLVVAPTSVLANWANEAARFTPCLKVLVLHGSDRIAAFDNIAAADVVITSYPLLHRDQKILVKTHWHCVILDEAQYIKNSKSITARSACSLLTTQRICLSGTPMENHLGELWSLMRFLMPGFLPEEKTFNSLIRRPIERENSSDARLALQRRISPLILRRTKDQVAADLPPKTELIHHIELSKKQVDLYEAVRASMDQRVRDAIAAKGLANSHIIVLDALLKLRQICCHPSLLSMPESKKTTESAKLDYLTDELLPQLLEEGRRILLFSQFTSMLAIIEAHLEKQRIPYLKLTGQTKERASLVEHFQTGTIQIFLISLKAGGTGLNLTAADTVIHYDPWWNPAAENQATDRAHRIGQNKPVFVHKLVCRGSIEDRILDLQKHKAALVKAVLSEEAGSLRIDQETLSQLLAPIG